MDQSTTERTAEAERHRLNPPHVVVDVVVVAAIVRGQYDRSEYNIFEIAS